MAAVSAGQVWSWATPTGDRRTMLVQYISAPLGGSRRVRGIHPQTGRPLQVCLAWLEKGLHDAKLERIVDGYTYTPGRR